MIEMLKRAISPPRLGSVALHVAAAVLALAIALSAFALILLGYGKAPAEVIGVVGQYAMTPEGWVAIINKATTYYLSGLAAAIGFRMYLFNIGIDGQYRLGVFAAAVVGASVSLPTVAHIALMIVVAMAVAGSYAAIAAYLRAYRGVSEVISTIMLNAIATGLISWLISEKRFGAPDPGSNNIQTALIPESGWMPAIHVPGAGDVYGFVVIATLLGIAFWFLTERTRFGFDLIASGESPRAALLSGSNPRRMIMLTLVASGLIAGLAGLPELLGSTHRYGISFPAGLAWTGLSVAIIGRNHPLGVAAGALLWAFLERCALPLDLIGIPKEVVSIVQAIVVLSVMVAYELVHRATATRERRIAIRFAQSSSTQEPV